METGAPSQIRVLNGCGTIGPLALARSHSSWYLCYTRPYGTSAVRIITCLNHISSSECILSLSPQTGNARFVASDKLGINGDLHRMLSLRDADGNPAIKLLEGSVHGHAVVEVLVPPAEVIHGCACCGKLEATWGPNNPPLPRFARCSGCQLRYYCSQECQKHDWSKRSPKALCHKEECQMLKDGKDYEVEQRLKLHDNYWWYPGRNFGGRKLNDEFPGETDFATYGQKLDMKPVKSRNSPFFGF